MISDYLNMFSLLAKYFYKDSKKFQKLKETNSTSNYFGVMGLLYPIIGVIFVAIFVYFGLGFIKSISGHSNILIVLGLVILGATFIISALFFFLFFLIRGIFVSIYQIRLQKKWLGIIALVFNVLFLIPTILLLLHLVKNGL